MTATENGGASGAKGGRLPYLQCLRALAALVVVAGHSANEIGQQLGEPAATGLRLLSPSLGVDIFFVISGFIILHASWTSFGEGLGRVRTFVTNRLVRIVPAYWLFTGLWLIAAAVLGGSMTRSAVDPAHLAASYMFLPYPRPEDGDLKPVLSLGWSLNYEMLFYAGFAGVLLLWRMPGVLLLSAVFVGLAVLHPFVPKGGALEFWTRPILLEFVLGLWIALLLRPHLERLLPAWAMAAVWLALGVLAMVVSGSRVDALPFGLVAALIGGVSVATAVIARPPQRPNGVVRAGVALGDSSYALYLSHPFTLNVVVIVWQRLGLDDRLPPVVLLVLMIVASALAAHVFYLLLERPTLAWLKARLVTPGARPRVA